MRIRPLRPSDLRYFNIPAFPLDTRVWVMEKRLPIAYAGYAMAPGLPHLADLYVYVMPAHRRRGYGSQLLAHVMSHIEEPTVTTLSAPVSHLSVPTAHFLHHHEFDVEHVELELVCNLVEGEFSADPSLIIAHGEPAAERMRQLYNDSFGGLPWYQPYEDADEILNDLGVDGEILLWQHNGESIGFVGVRYVRLVADIEPLGVIQPCQGKGIGQRLLGATLAYLQQIGCIEAQLAVWQQNKPAVQLYRKFGFRPKSQRIFMARKIRE